VQPAGRDPLVDRVVAQPGRPQLLAGHLAMLPAAGGDDLLLANVSISANTADIDVFG
jgi:hypothetical protein